MKGFPGGPDGTESAYNVGYQGSMPESGRSPGGRHGNPLRYSCLENPMDRGAWQAAVHRVAKSQTRPSDWHFLFFPTKEQKSVVSSVPGAIMGGPARDEEMKKIPGRQGRPGPHPWRGHEEKTWQARPSRIRDPPGWPRPLSHPVSSPFSAAVLVRPAADSCVACRELSCSSFTEWGPT